MISTTYRFDRRSYYLYTLAELALFWSYKVTISATPTTVIENFLRKQ